MLRDERKHEVAVALHGGQVQGCQARHGACVDEGFVHQQGIAHLREGTKGMIGSVSFCEYDNDTLRFSRQLKAYQLVAVFCCQMESGLALAVKHVDPRLIVKQRGHDALVTVLCSV